jgi:hypothetical protein
LNVGKLVAERQVLQNSIGIRRINLLGSAETAAALRAFGSQQMALACAGAHHFATTGYLEPFGNRLLRFDTFGASHKFTFLCKRAGNIPVPQNESSAILTFSMGQNAAPHE